MMMVMILTMTMTGNIIQDLKGSNIIQGHEWSHLSDGSDEIARIRQKWHICANLYFLPTCWTQKYFKYLTILIMIQKKWFVPIYAFICSSLPWPRNTEGDLNLDLFQEDRIRICINAIQNLDWR